MSTEQRQAIRDPGRPLAGSVAVVTGAAKGLGRAISELLADQGADLALAGRAAGDLEAHAADLDRRFPGRRTAALPTDVTDDDAVRRLIDATVEQLGGLDVLVNTAGVIGPIETPAQDVGVDDFRHVIEVNLVGTFLPCKYAIPHLIARGGGRIVNVAGTSGLRGYRNRVAYSSSKWAVRGLTRTLALEHGPHDVTVNAVCPHVTNGARMDTIIREKARKIGSDPEAVHDAFAGETALGRFIDDVDVAHTVGFLVSAGARNITGHEIVVDAGWDV